MRVLLINYEFPPVGGGGANAALNLSRELTKKGHAIKVVTSRYRGLPSKETVDGVTIRRIPALRKNLFYCSTFEMFSFLVSALTSTFFCLRRERYDLLWVYFGLPDGPVGVMAKTLFGVPFVLRMGGGDVPGFKPFRYRWAWKILTPVVRRVWRRAAFCVTPSAGLAERVSAVDHTIRPVVIPNGVDTTRFSPSEKNGSPSGCTLLCVSQLIKRKGLDLLLHAFAEVKKNSNLDLRLRLAGSGPEKEALQQLAETLNVSKSVDFIGHINRGDLPAVYQSADLFVLPSHAEGMSNALLEALSSGLPCIVTNTHGVTELIQDSVEGLIVPLRDTAALSGAINDLARDVNKRRRMGEAARKKALEFNWSKMAENYETLFLSALKERS